MQRRSLANRELQCQRAWDKLAALVNRPYLLRKQGKNLSLQHQQRYSMSTALHGWCRRCVWRVTCSTAAQRHRHNSIEQAFRMCFRIAVEQANIRRSVTSLRLRLLWSKFKRRIRGRREAKDRAEGVLGEVISNSPSRGRIRGLTLFTDDSDIHLSEGMSSSILFARSPQLIRGVVRTRLAWYFTRIRQWVGMGRKRKDEIQHQNTGLRKRRLLRAVRRLYKIMCVARKRKRVLGKSRSFEGASLPYREGLDGTGLYDRLPPRPFSSPSKSVSGTSTYEKDGSSFAAHAHTTGLPNLIVNDAQWRKAERAWKEKRRMRWERMMAMLVKNLTRPVYQSQQSRALMKWVDYCRAKGKASRLHHKLVWKYIIKMLKRTLQRLYSRKAYKQKRRERVTGRNGWMQKMVVYCMRRSIHRLCRLTIRRGIVYALLTGHLRRRASVAMTSFLHLMKRLVHFRKRNALLRCTMRVRKMTGVFLFVLKRQTFSGSSLRNVSIAHELAVRNHKTKGYRLFKNLLEWKRGVQSLLRASYLSFIRKSAHRMIQQWHTLCTQKKLLRRCCRRFYLKPAMRSWLSDTIIGLRNRRIMTHCSRRTADRLKMDCFFLWKVFAARSVRLGLQYTILSERIQQVTKVHVVLAWLKVMDDKMNRSKAHKVKKTHKLAVQRRALSHWRYLFFSANQASLLSSRAALRNWYATHRHRHTHTHIY